MSPPEVMICGHQIQKIRKSSNSQLNEINVKME